MTIGILTLYLFIPDSQSLKAKRSVLKRLKNDLAGKFNVCVAEVDCQDKWQRCVLALGFINIDRRVIDSTFSQVVKFIESAASVQLLDFAQELI